MKSVKLLSIALLGFFAVVLVACSSHDSSPESVATAYVQAAYKGDADGMIKLLYLPKEEMKDGSEEMVKGKIKQAAAKSAAEADRKGGVKEVVVENSDIDAPNGKGVVQVIVHFKNEGSDSAKNRVRVIRSDDKWKVNP